MEAHRVSAAAQARARHHFAICPDKNQQNVSHLNHDDGVMGDQRHARARAILDLLTDSERAGCRRFELGRSVSADLCRSLPPLSRMPDEMLPSQPSFGSAR
jgi:hypothetical protein